MKILIGLQYYYPYRSGLTEYARLLIEGLLKRGHSVTVVTSQSSPDLPLKEDVMGAQVLRMPVLFRMDRAAVMPAFIPKILSMSRHYDVINLHAPLPELGILAWCLRRRSVVVTYQCDIVIQGGFLARWIEAIYFKITGFGLRFPQAVIFLNEDYLAQSKVRSSTKNARTILPPIKPFARTDFLGFRKRLKIEEDEQVIGFIGRLVFEKGLDDLIEAFGIIQQSMPKTKLVIAGDDQVAGRSNKKALSEKAEPFGKAALFTGFIEEELMPEFYSLCDVLVLPSVERLEAFGMVQVEAMLCGTPAVATDLPGVGVAIKLTKMGRLVPPRNPPELAKGIIDILQNKEHYVVDRDRILELFGIDKTAEAYEKAFHDLSKI